MKTFLRKIKNSIINSQKTDKSKFVSNEYLRVDSSDLLPVSICIPAYEMYGKGAEHLDRSLNMLSKQTWKNFEVVVSDHSISELIKDCCDKYKDLLDINYLRNPEHRGSSCENSNNALNHAKNPIIRFLFQDDYLSDESALERASKYFMFSKANWMVTACNHRKDETGEIFWERYPLIIENQLLTANNGLGCPSVVMVKKNELRFDKRLPALMDIDYYHLLTEKFGSPVIFNDINSTIGVHPGQITNNGGAGDPEQVKRELEILKIKYQTIKLS